MASQVATKMKGTLTLSDKDGNEIKYKVVMQPFASSQSVKTRKSTKRLFFVNFVKKGAARLKALKRNEAKGKNHEGTETQTPQTKPGSSYESEGESESNEDWDQRYARFVQTYGRLMNNGTKAKTPGSPSKDGINEDGGTFTAGSKAPSYRVYGKGSFPFRGYHSPDSCPKLIPPRRVAF